MKARLVKNQEGLWLLYPNGCVVAADVSKIRDLLYNFKHIPKHKKIPPPATVSAQWKPEYPDMTAYPGETIAYVTEELHLVIVDIEPFAILPVESTQTVIDKLVTITEYAKTHNKSIEQVKVFCRTGRIPGAKKIGRDWVLSVDAPYPVDQRITSGNFIKRK